jgi:hypothetical protein
MQEVKLIFLEFQSCQTESDIELKNSFVNAGMFDRVQEKSCFQYSLFRRSSVSVQNETPVVQRVSLYAS